MTICEATSKRIEQLCRQKRLTGYSLTFQACLLYTSRCV